MEHRGQVLDQRTEVHASVGRKVEQDLGVVKGLFHAHQLHVQLVLLDLVLADAVGFLFKLLVFGGMAGVRLCSDAQHLLERRGDQIVIHLAYPRDDLTVLHPARGFHDDIAARRRPQPARVKIIQLSCILKSYANDCRHLVCSSNSLIIRWSMLDCQLT